MSNYAFIGPAWSSDTVTWYYTGDQKYAAGIAQAFERWDQVLDLDFNQASSAGAADITVDFGYLDGASNTLAEAWSYWSGSNYTGAAITFDTAETWTWSQAAGSYVLPGGATFYAVALHEIGHSLGLDHPTNSATIMYAYASGGVTDLTSWDIAGGQQLYGAETGGSSNFTEADDVVTLTTADGAPVYALGGNDRITGTATGDSIYGNGGNDTINSGQGADQLIGGSGTDVLRGGAGFDRLWGGAGSDYFDFNVRTESSTTLASTDVIKDFDAYDFIDLSTIDSNTKQAGNQNFKFIGSQAFHKIAGELHFVRGADHVLVQGDVNGDGHADFQIKVDGLTTIARYDFVL